MVETPTAATMRLDGGHPALDLVNTIYGQVGGPVEHDVLASPADLVTFARRVGVAGEATPAGEAAWRAAVDLRDALDPVLRDPAHPAGPVEAAARAALAAGSLQVGAGWVWPDEDAMAPVHRLAHAAAALLGDPAAMAVLHTCDGCCWMFLDRSRNQARRWCSMADCGTEAKKRRYVATRRSRRERGS
jgi:predicted RNA-binding Zn ribbon-like protein